MANDGYRPGALCLIFIMCVLVNDGSYIGSRGISSHKLILIEPSFNVVDEQVLRVIFANLSDGNFDLLRPFLPRRTVVNSSSCDILEDYTTEMLSQYSFAENRNCCFAVISLFCESAAVHAANLGRELGIPVISSVWKSHSDVSLPVDHFSTRFDFDIGSMDLVSKALAAFFETFSYINMALVCKDNEVDPFLSSACLHSRTFLKRSFITTQVNVPETMDAALKKNNPCRRALVSAMQFSRVMVFFLSMIYVHHCLVFISITSPHEDHSVVVTRKTERFFQKLTENQNQNVYAQLFFVFLNEPVKQDASKFAKQLDERSTTNSSTNQSALPSSFDGLTAFLIHRLVDMFVKTIDATKEAEILNENGNVKLLQSLHRTWNQLQFTSQPSFNVLFGTLLPSGSVQTFATYDDQLPGILTLAVNEDDMSKQWPGSIFPPPNQPSCGFRGLSCPTQGGDAWIGLLSAVVFFIISLCCLLGYRSKTRSSTKTATFTRTLTDDLKWNIVEEELLPLPMVDEKSVRIKSTTSINSVILNGVKPPRTSGKFLYMNRKVWVKSRELTYGFSPEDQHINFLRKASRLTHPNFSQLFGIVLSSDPIVFELKMVMECWDRGSLYDLIGQSNAENFSFALKAALIRDIVTAMTYLHNSFIVCHGSLKSPNCLISDRFTVKISDYGLNMFPIHPPHVVINEYFYHGMLWTAPERLREPIMWIRKGSKSADTYSFGIILQEIFTLAAPFFDFDKSKKMSPKEIIFLLIQRPPTPFRPVVPLTACPDKILYSLMPVCWTEDPLARPSFKQIDQTLEDLPAFRNSATYLEYLLRKMDAYSQKLEDRVRESTAGLMEEKKRSDELLAQMLPRRVLQEMKKGYVVTPEMFERVTIGFTAVSDFALITNCSTPLQIITFLNDIYVTFDAIVERFDVYKVETIQDSYMIASGVPERNGVEHANQICSMALEMLHFSKVIRIAHMDQTTIEMKIGVHTGGCAAGLVGSMAARYCLFGDTINTASRMCSAGEAQTIQVSESTKQFLEDHHTACFKLTLRGETEVKGKGKMRTYFLTRKTSFIS